MATFLTSFKKPVLQGRTSIIRQAVLYKIGISPRGRGRIVKHDFSDKTFRLFLF